jgi:CheY-like chemotaxis protein
VDRPSVQRRSAERRRLWDRRSPDARRGTERRSRTRRSSDGLALTERRRGADRRHADDRRGAAERRGQMPRRRGRRRRETPTPYTVEQMTELKQRFAAPGAPACPACGGRFTLGPSRRRGGESPRRVMCLGCARAAVVPHSRAARILLVDARSELRDGLQALLSSAGHEVIEAADPGVALLAYQMVPADLVIIDVAAPGRVRPPEFVRRLRRVFPDARVVALAGRASHAGMDPLALAHALGAVRTLRVPVAKDELLRVIDEARG